jgi:hypothetical protein
VSHPDGHACPLGQAQDIAAVMVDMAVDNVVRAMLARDPFKVASVQTRPPWMKARDNPATESADFVVVSAGLRCVNQKIHVEAITINVTQNMHEPGFHAASDHPT